MKELLTERALAFARRLVKIESITYHERECAEELAKILSGFGFQASIDDGNNVIARLPGRDPSAKKLLFIGHHDTVDLGDLAEWDFPPLEAIVENGRLHGRGSNDEKGGLAGFLAAVETLLATGETPEGDLLLVSTREEISDIEERGIVRVLRRGLQADACICLEPTETRMMLGHRGRAVTDFRVRGRAAHASLPARGVNAVSSAARLILALNQMELPGTDPDWQGTQAVTMITGGVKDNIVPEECRLSTDRRILDGEDEHTLAREYQAVIDRLQKEDPAFRAEFQIRPPYYAARTDGDDDFVKTMKQIFEEAGLPAEPEIFPGHTDSEWIINDLGIPCVIVGPGSLSTAHTAHEYVPVEDLGAVADVYYRLLRCFWD